MVGWASACSTIFRCKLCKQTLQVLQLVQTYEIYIRVYTTRHEESSQVIDMVVAGPPY